MTRREIKAGVEALGMKVRWTGNGREMRVNFPGGGESTAYYTEDGEDAIGTAKAMAKALTA